MVADLVPMDRLDSGHTVAAAARTAVVDHTDLGRIEAGRIVVDLAHASIRPVVVGRHILLAVVVAEDSLVRSSALAEHRSLVAGHRVVDRIHLAVHIADSDRIRHSSVLADTGRGHHSLLDCMGLTCLRC